MSPDHASILQDQPLVNNCQKCHRLNWRGVVCDHQPRKVIPAAPTGIINRAAPIHSREFNFINHADGTHTPTKELIYDVGPNTREIFWVKLETNDADMGVMTKYKFGSGIGSEAEQIGKARNKLALMFVKHYDL